MKFLIIIILAVFCLCNVSSLQCYDCNEQVSIITSCSSPSKMKCSFSSDVCITATKKNGKSFHGCGQASTCKDVDGDDQKCKSCKIDLCNNPEGYVDPDDNKPGGHDDADDEKDNNQGKTIQCYECIDGFPRALTQLPSCSTPAKVKCDNMDNVPPFCVSGTKDGGKQRYHGCSCSDFENCLSCHTDFCNKPEGNVGANAKNGGNKGNGTSSAVTLKNNAIPLLSLFLILIFSCCLINARI